MTLTAATLTDWQRPHLGEPFDPESERGQAIITDRAGTDPADRAAFVHDETEPCECCDLRWFSEDMVWSSRGRICRACDDKPTRASRSQYDPDSWKADR